MKYIVENIVKENHGYSLIVNGVNCFIEFGEDDDNGSENYMLVIRAKEIGKNIGKGVGKPICMIFQKQTD